VGWRFLSLYKPNGKKKLTSTCQGNARWVRNSLLKKANRSTLDWGEYGSLQDFVIPTRSQATQSARAARNLLFVRVNRNDAGGGV
jgi:hypothetical protein